MENIKRAIILAGGKGTRLKPYTIVMPKPLMPIGDFPILEVVIKQLKINGFNHITLAVNHQAELIQAFFRKGEKWGLHIDYSLEDAPLSTMGPLKIIKGLPENFLVMNGDVLTDLDFATFYYKHVEKKFLMTVAAHKRIQTIDYGILEVNKKKEIVGFREKPRIPYLVSMGIYMLNEKILDMIPEREPYGFDDLMLNLLESSSYAHVEEHKGYWLDIGRPEDYATAIEQFSKDKYKFLKEKE